VRKPYKGRSQESDNVVYSGLLKPEMIPDLALSASVAPPYGGLQYRLPSCLKWRSVPY
jgi:hypothetical protein